MTDAGLTAAQLANARQIVAEGRAKGASDLQIRIALMTALTESNLLNYANKNNPESLAIAHEAVGSDHASVGVFQQQVGIWGDTRTLMDVKASAGKFYDALFKAGRPNSSQPWLTAQAVQRSAFSDGSNYQRNWELAGQVLASTGGGVGVDASAPGMDGPLPQSWLSSAQAIGKTLQDPAFWQRAGIFLLGAVLVGIVLWKITGAEQLIAKGTKLAAKVAL